MNGTDDIKTALEAAVPGLEVYDIERPYPVQVRGTISGHRFSFYAKGNFLDVTGTWELSISDTAGPWTPQMLRIWSMAGWCHEEKYENKERDAGDMPEADVIACISKAVGLWRVRSDPRGPSRLFVPAEAMQNDALILGLHHIGATEEQTIESLAKDRARLLDELARYKEKSTWPVVFVMKQAEVKA